MENIDFSTFKIPELPPLNLGRMDFAQRILDIGDQVSDMVSSIELSAKLDISSQLKNISNDHIDTYA